MFKTQKITDDYTYKPQTVKNSYGINSISFNDKPKGWKVTNPGQSEKVSSMNTRTKLYDISNSNGGVSVSKRDHLTPKLPDFTSSTTKRPGSIIKDNIKNVLAKKYGELDVRHLFDDIEDAEIENNIPTAEATIKTNIDKRNLNKDIYSRLPYLRDGLALSYAAANKGRSKAATRAREAGYTEQSPLKASDIQPKSQPTKYSNFYTDYLENKKTPQSNNSWNIFGKTNELPGINKNPRYVSADILNMRSAPGVNSKIVGGLPNGTEVHYTGNKTEEIDGHLWAEVTYDGKTGWVAADYLKTAKPQNDSIPTAVTTQKSAQSISIDSVNNGSKIDINDHSALQTAFNNVRKPGATDDNPGDPGDFDGVWGLQCVDLPNWFLDNYTTLGRVNGDGKDIVQNIASKHNLEVTTTPTAPAVFSVKEGTYGPGIRTGGVSDATAGHTGIVLAVKDLGDDLYDITYIDTYNGLKNNEYNSNINTKTFKKGDNVTYVSLEGHLK